MSDNKEKNEKTDENNEPDEENGNNEPKKWDRNSHLPPHMMKRWYGGGPHTDMEITTLFKEDLIDIGTGTLAHW